MRQRDTQDVNAAVQGLVDALFQLQEIYDDSLREGYTVSQNAYSDPQKQAQQSIIDAMYALDAIVGTDDVFIADDGTVIDLPYAPLERGPDGLPQFPQ